MVLISLRIGESQLKALSKLRDKKKKDSTGKIITISDHIRIAIKNYLEKK